MNYHDLRHVVNVVERQRELASDRQRRRNHDLAAQVINPTQRFCLACKTTFQPKQRRAWFCCRRCIERVSWHRKQARVAEAAAMARDYRQSAFGTSNHLPLEELRRRWREEPRDNEVNYRLWFPDLCGLSPEQALAEREQFQAVCNQNT
jgi:hypothetical protein